MPIEIGPIAPVRALGTSPRGPASERKPAAQPSSAVQIEATALSAAPPVDADRVATIRAALADGSYPLVPARIADAMIAAGLRLSLGQ